MKFRSRTNEDMTMISIRLFTSDLEYLRQAYTTIGYNRTIRTIVRRFVRQCNQADAAIVDLTKEPDTND